MEHNETTLTDDSEFKRVLTKRGSKYPERIIHERKSAISLMLCGNAMGETLPPYTVCKAESMLTTCTERGPDHARFNRSKSGWFDGVMTFEGFFFSFTTVLPRLQKQEAGRYSLVKIFLCTAV